MLRIGWGLNPHPIRTLHPTPYTLPPTRTVQYRALVAIALIVRNV
ncbi:hypothetical protein [Brasilonema sp. UFV-L1]